MTKKELKALDARIVMKLACCCCGDLALAKKQWWNRDTGYGLCGRCAKALQARKGYDAEEFISCYGHEGVNWIKEA